MYYFFNYILFFVSMNLSGMIMSLNLFLLSSDSDMSFLWMFSMCSMLLSTGFLPDIIFMVIFYCFLILEFAEFLWSVVFYLNFDSWSMLYYLYKRDG